MGAVRNLHACARLAAAVMGHPVGNQHSVSPPVASIRRQRNSSHRCHVESGHRFHVFASVQHASSSPARVHYNDDASETSVPQASDEQPHSALVEASKTQPQLIASDGSTSEGALALEGTPDVPPSNFVAQSMGDPSSQSNSDSAHTASQPSSYTREDGVQQGADPTSGAGASVPAMTAGALGTTGPAAGAAGNSPTSGDLQPTQNGRPDNIQDAQHSAPADGQATSPSTESLQPLPLDAVAEREQFLAQKLQVSGALPCTSPALGVL